MTDREKFRFDMLTLLARQGLSPGQALDRVKSASAITELFKWPLYSAAGAVGLGTVGGAAGGYLLAKATEKDIDPEEARRQELIAAYKQHTDRIRRNMRRQYRPSASSK